MRRARLGLRMSGISRARPAGISVDRIEIERARDESSTSTLGFASPSLDLREIALRGLALLRQHFARHAALGALVAHPRADIAQQRGVFGTRGL